MKKKMTKTKKQFRKDEPPIPFHYKFYLVYWEDIQSSNPAICVSTGWLVKKDKKVHILMSDYNYDDKGEMADGGNTTVIPTKNVIRKYEIEGL